MRLVRTSPRPFYRSIGAAVCLLGAACGATETPPPPPPPMPPSIALVSGDGQDALVGDPLLPFVVRVFDANGPRPGRAVTFAAAIEGGNWGTLALVNTGPDGVASLRWQPDPRPGTWLVRASVSERDTVRFSVRVSQGPPHSIETCCGLHEFVPLSGTVPYPLPITVRDKGYNPIAGLTVTFRVASGGGTIADSVQVTNGEGVARLSHWTFGPSDPIQTVSATVEGGLSGIIAIRGAPHGIEIVSGDNQRGNVATYLKEPLVVRVLGPGGAPLGAGFPVSFESPGLYILPGDPTDSTGTARSGQIQLNGEPGTSTVTARSFDQSVSFTVSHSVPTPTQIIPLSGSGLTTFAGNLFATQPSFRLVDSVGDPISGHHPLTFTASDGGTVQAFGYENAPRVTYTSPDGVGTILAWRLGTTLGEQSLRAAYDGVELPGKLTTTVVPAPAASQFNIEVRFSDTLLADSVRQAIRDAAQEWTKGIVGDLPDVPLDLPADEDGCYPALRETVDDLLIFVSVVRGDGPGGALAGATPCLVREGSLLPLVSLILIDEADLEFLGKFRMGRVALHEIGHTLGFGTLWQALDLFRPPPSEDGYVGRAAAAAFSEAVSPSRSVPVEHGGGPGTRYSHWANVFPDLMVGYLMTGHVLSSITLGAMRDLGYVVDDRAAEPFPPVALRTGPVRDEGFREWVPEVRVRTVGPRGAVSAPRNLR